MEVKDLVGYTPSGNRVIVKHNQLSKYFQEWYIEQRHKGFEFFDYCVYLIKDATDFVRYIGHGKDGDIEHLDFTKSRINGHYGDLLSAVMQKDWSIEIVLYGISENESRMVEARFIDIALEGGMKLTPKGSKEWDGVSLINKQRETTWNERAKKCMKI